MRKSLRFLFLPLISLIVILLGFVACTTRRGEPSPDKGLGVTELVTFDVYEEPVNSGVYHADSTTTSSSYTGTLKWVVESAVAELHVNGGGTIAFGADVFDLGTDFFKIEQKDNITFKGQLGSGDVKLTTIQNSSDAAADTEPFNFTESNYITIRDLIVVAGGADRTTSDAIDGDGMNYSLIDNVEITDSRGDGIVLDGKNAQWTANNNIIRNCKVYNVPNGGIQLLNAHNNLIENCEISNVTNGSGINVNKASASYSHQPSNNNIIRNNTIDNTFSHGIRVHSSNQNSIIDNTVTNITNSAVNGIHIFSTSGIVCDDNVVSDNTATNNAGFGLRINSPECNRTEVWDTNTLTGNTKGEIYNNGTNTIFINSQTDTEPPSQPGNLTFYGVQDDEVTLSWDPSTDNVEVVAYDIYRDNVNIDYVGGLTTTYRDILNVEPETTYEYFVRARDDAGNESLPSDTVTVLTLPAPILNTFTATRDATIKESSPNVNYGTLDSLEIDSDSPKDVLLHFDVTGIGSATINKVSLQLYATDGSNFGGEFFEAASSNWSEGTVTWNNAPSKNGTPLGSLGYTTANTWYNLDLPLSFVNGDGPVDIRISSTSTNGADYASRENLNDNAPKLIIETSGTGEPDTEPPSPPNLHDPAPDIQYNEVTLSWDPSTDNAGVVGYDIYRDNVNIGDVEGFTTTYQDKTVSPDNTYAYFVRARDAAGNESQNSNTINVTTPSLPQIITFTPTDDATIQPGNKANRNYGNRISLQADANLPKEALLRFDVSGIGSATINSVSLRLYVTNSSNFGGNFFEVTNNDWNEDTVTWNNAPPGDGMSLGSLGQVDVDTWSNLDLPLSFVDGDGPVSIRISSTSNNGVDYASEENSNGNAPELVITLD